MTEEELDRRILLRRADPVKLFELHLLRLMMQQTPEGREALRRIKEHAERYADCVDTVSKR